MPKKKSAIARESITHQYEDDPPPPYSPSETSGPSSIIENPTISPSAPTAADVVFYPPERTTVNYDQEAEHIDSSEPPHNYNYGSIQEPNTTGDVHQEGGDSFFVNVENQIRAHWNQNQVRIQQQLVQARQQREQARQQREQAYHRRAQALQSASHGDSLHAVGDRLREQGNRMRSGLADLGDQIRSSLNGPKPQYTRVSQTDGGDTSHTGEELPLTGRKRSKRCLRTFSFLVFILLVISLIVLLTVSGQDPQDSNDDPKLPNPSSPPSSSPSKTVPNIPPSDIPSNPPMNPPSDPPSNPPKTPEDPNIPGHPPDGSSCGTDCVVASYRWPLRDNMRSFSYLQSGTLSSGRAIIKRSRSSASGNVYITLELTNVKSSDGSTVFSADGTNGYVSAVVSTPKALSPFSRINLIVTIELPKSNITDFQEFSFMGRNTDIVFENVSDIDTVDVGKLSVTTTNGDITLSGLFVTATSHQIVTRNADIRGIVRSNGKVEISTSNGNIGLDAAGENIILSTTNGDVTGEYNSVQKCNLETSSGDVNIQKIQANTLVMETKNGRIHVQNVTSVANIIARGKNGPMRLNVEGFDLGTVVIAANKNAPIDITMPMQYQGAFYLSTTKGFSAKALLDNPPDPGHSLDFKIISGSYVSGKKLSPFNIKDGSVTAGTENGDVTLTFANLHQSNLFKSPITN